MGGSCNSGVRIDRYLQQMRAASLFIVTERHHCTHRDQGRKRDNAVWRMLDTRADPERRQDEVRS